MTYRNLIHKYQNCSGGKLEFTDPYANHIGVSFDAFLTEMNQTFSLSYDTEEVYGRNDPIMSYRNTKRTISLAWFVPSNSLYEAKLNRLKTRLLIRMLYPRYDNSNIKRIEAGSPEYKRRDSQVEAFLRASSVAYNNSQYMTENYQNIHGNRTAFQDYFTLKAALEEIRGFDRRSFFEREGAAFTREKIGYNHTQTMVENPIISIKYANLISADAGRPLTGYLDGLSPQPVLDQGFYTECTGHVINPITKKKEAVVAGQYPKVYQMSCNFNVIHTSPLGFYDDGYSLSDIFYY